MRLPALRSTAVLAAALALGACTPAEPPDTTAADTAAINAIRATWVQAYNAGDAAALAALYTDDAVEMTAEQPTVTGRAAREAGFAELFSGATVSSSVSSDELQVMDGSAVDIGTFSTMITPKGEGEPQTESGRYMVVLEKQADGAWKISRLMTNHAAPPPMPAAGGSR